MKHLFVVNPVAGGKKGKVEDTLREIGSLSFPVNDSFETYITKGPMDAYGKIIEDAGALTGSGADDTTLRIYACGGDGTLNECINGATGCANAAVTHFPCGTGNDFLKTFPVEELPRFRDFNALLTGAVKPLDVIECTFDGGSSGTGSRYGINICSVGIDARIGTDVHKYSSIPVIGGSMGYVVSLIVNVIKGIVQPLQVSLSGVADETGIPLDDMFFDKKLTLVCVCNGRYYGGGFNPVPDALPDDGFLDCLVVEPVSRLQVAQIVGRFSKGMFAEFPDVFNYARCTGADIRAAHEFVVNIDGEAVYAKSVRFRLIPGGVNFIFP